MSKSPILTNTPVETYRMYDAKREDLACKKPGPPFAKVRGLWQTLIDLKKQGIQHVGYMETAISMAGWGISYFCHLIGGITPTIYYPQYKDGLILNLERHHKIWTQYGAEIVPLKAARLQINWYLARKKFFEQYGEKNCHMLPQGMPCEYSVGATADEVHLLKNKYGSIVVCVGSGVQLSGIVRGLSQLELTTDVYGIFVAPKSEKVMHQKILKLSGLSGEGFFNTMTADLHLVDCGFVYDQPETISTPFPCNPYYDRKAYKWMLDHYEELEKPILFWNIGA